MPTPKSPMTTHRSTPESPPNPPENISIIAAIMATIGSTMSNCVHGRPEGVGSSGGESRMSSPLGCSGAGRRTGLRTTTVAITIPFHRDPMSASLALLAAAGTALAGTCRAARRVDSSGLASNRTPAAREHLVT
ncbi:hypothetical protein ACFSVJ_27580 [Prauserella oleivorans]